MKYLVTMHSTGYEQVEVEAENPAEALQKAKAARPTLSGSATAGDLSEFVPNPDFDPETDDESERFVEGGGRFSASCLSPRRELLREYRGR